MTQNNAWTYHGLALGGTLVVDCLSAFVFCVLWGWMLMRGLVDLPPVTKDVDNIAERDKFVE